MVNAGLVNGGALCHFHCIFAKILRVFAPIPRFQNPVKYTHKFRINHKTLHFAALTHARVSKIILRYQPLNYTLTLSQGALRIISSINGMPAIAPI
jgi:hypothetical protein